MKKKSILFGVALAAAAVLGLASCGGNGNNGSSSSAAASSSSEASTSAASSSSEASTSAASSSSEASTSAASSSSEASTSAASTSAAASTTAADTYKVSFKVGDTVIAQKTADDKGKVETPALSEITAPTGKRFDFWSADGVTAFDTTKGVPNDENVELTAVFVDQNDYDTLANSANKIIASTFYKETIVAEDTSFDDTVNFGATTASSVTATTDNKIKLESDTLVADFGGKKEAGIITAYAEVELDALKAEAFFQFEGTSATKASHAEVFAIRAGSSKLAYRLDGGADVTLCPVSTSTVYKLKVVLDMADGKLDVYVNDEKKASNVSTTINSVYGLKFTAKSTGETPKTIDNVAVTYVAKQLSALAQAQQIALKNVNDYVESESYTGATAEVKALIDAQVKTTKAAITAAADETAVGAAVTTWNTFKAAEKVTVTVKASGKTVADYKVGAVVGSKLDLTKVKFAGFTVNKIFTDEACTAEFTAESTVSASNTTLYATVTEAVQTGASLNIAALTTGDIVSDVVVDDTFSILANSSKKVTVAESSKTHDDGFTCTKMIKTNGVSSTTYRTVKITVNSACKITVYGYTGSNGNERVLELQNASGTKVAELKSSTTDLSKVEYNATAAGVYYLVATTNSFNICGVVVG